MKKALKIGLISLASLFLVIAMMALCMVPALADKPMNTGKWYDDGMNEFIDKGYITGYGNGDYGPERNMTRAEYGFEVNRWMKEYDLQHLRESFGIHYFLARKKKTA